MANTTGAYDGKPKGDYSLDVTRGLINGQSSLNKFGRNPDIDTGSTPEDITDNGGLYVPPTEPRIHDIKSSSSNDAGVLVSSGLATGGSSTSLIDTGANFVAEGVVVGDAVIEDDTMEHSIVKAVTPTELTLHESRRHGSFSGKNYRVINATSGGASIIHVYGLDGNMEHIDEFIIADSTTNVPTLKSYWRINRMHIDGGADRTSTNNGDITATAKIDGTITCKIIAGNGQSLMAFWTVARGEDFYMDSYYGSINKTGGTSGAMTVISLNETAFASRDGAGSRIQHIIGLSVTGSSYIRHEFAMPKHFAAETDIWVRCESVTDNNTDITAGFSGIIIKRPT